MRTSFFCLVLSALAACAGQNQPVPGASTSSLAEPTHEAATAAEPVSTGPRPAVMPSLLSAPVPSGVPVAQVAPPPGRDGMRAPYVLRLDGPAIANPGEKIEVAATLERNGAFSAPIALQARTAEGITILSGPRDEKLEFGDRTTIMLRWTLQVMDPSASFEVRAIASGEGFGVNAAKRLVFDGSSLSRPEPPRPGGILRAR